MLVKLLATKELGAAKKFWFCILFQNKDRHLSYRDTHYIDMAVRSTTHYNENTSVGVSVFLYWNGLQNPYQNIKEIRNDARWEHVTDRQREQIHVNVYLKSHDIFLYLDACCSPSRTFVWLINSCLHWLTWNYRQVKAAVWQWRLTVEAETASFVNNRKAWRGLHLRVL